MGLGDGKASIKGKRPGPIKPQQTVHGTKEMIEKKAKLALGFSRKEKTNVTEQSFRIGISELSGPAE